MKVFEQLESNVRSYCRTFPAVFTAARGHELIDESGKHYIDFFAGAGALNYGHANPRLKQRLLDYIEQDGPVHTLDMATTAKRSFMESFQERILAPRGLIYKLQFPGPTGTNAVEAALKLARKVTGRTSVIAFTNGFHGMTLGSLAVTGNLAKRAGAGVPLAHTHVVPFDGYMGKDLDTLAYLARLLEDPSSGIDHPAAVIVETVQAEGGVNVASWGWLEGLAALLRRHEVLLIVDDIQVGCGRTGSFFSFEGARIQPDIVCLSKSLSGYGLPLSLVLLRPELDVWSPGEHNGTFRGNNLAFVTGTEALEYWRDETLSQQVKEKASMVRARLDECHRRHAGAVTGVRGRGLIQGLVLEPPGLAVRVSREAFQRGLIIETAGPRDELLKLLPPLTVPDDALENGLTILDESLHATLGASGS